MKSLLTFLAVAVFVAGCERHEDPEKVRSAIEAMDKEFVAAFNNEDLDGIMKHYWNSPQLVTMYPDGDYVGYDALKANWQKTFDEVEVKKFEVPQHNIEVGHHMAYDWGTWNYTFQPVGGPEMNISGRYLQVWAEKDGKWVIVADHASVPLPPLPPPMEPAAEGKDKKK
jgi:ketosteroid isomerase-like protein